MTVAPSESRILYVIFYEDVPANAVQSAFVQLVQNLKSRNLQAYQVWNGLFAAQPAFVRLKPSKNSSVLTSITTGTRRAEERIAERVRAQPTRNICEVVFLRTSRTHINRRHCSRSLRQDHSTQIALKNNH